MLDGLLVPLRALVRCIRRSCKATTAAAMHNRAVATARSASARVAADHRDLEFEREYSARIKYLREHSLEFRPHYQEIVRLQYDVKTRFVSAFFLLASLQKHWSAVEYAMNVCGFESSKCLAAIIIFFGCCYVAQNCRTELGRA